MTKNTSTPDWKSLINTLEGYGDLYLVKKAPALPGNIKDILVKIAPYLAILGLVLSLPALLSLFGLGAISLPFAAYTHVRVGFSYLISLAVLFVNLFLMAKAIPGLFAKTVPGWRFMFYASLVNALHSLLRFDLGSLVIGSLISFYFLFQVKSYYK